MYITCNAEFQTRLSLPQRGPQRMMHNYRWPPPPHSQYPGKFYFQEGHTYFLLTCRDWRRCRNPGHAPTEHEQTAGCWGDQPGPVCSVYSCYWSSLEAGWRVALEIFTYTAPHTRPLKMCVLKTSYVVHCTLKTVWVQTLNKLLNSQQFTSSKYKTHIHLSSKYKTHTHLIYRPLPK